MEKVIVIHNNIGHGRESERVARFCTRFPFPKDLWRYAGLAKGYQHAFEDSLLAAGGEVCEIKALPGIVEIGVYDFSYGVYDLVVTRAAAYSWEELEPQILELLYRRHDRLSQVDIN